MGKQQELKEQIVEIIIGNAEKIAEEILNGKDVEIKTCNSGIKIMSVGKTVLK